VGNAIQDQAVVVNQAFSYTIPSNTFSDPDGHTLTYTTKTSDGTAWPNWLKFDSIQRRFSGTPVSVKTYSIAVTASDSIASVTNSFNIIVDKSNQQQSQGFNEGIIVWVSIPLIGAGAAVSIGACIVMAIYLGIYKKKKSQKEGEAASEDIVRYPKINQMENLGLQYELNEYGLKVPMVSNTPNDMLLAEQYEPGDESDPGKRPMVPDAPEGMFLAESETRDNIPTGKRPSAPEMGNEFSGSMTVQKVKFEEYTENAPDNFNGPITQELMVNPYILAETGQTYEKEAIMTWLAKHDTDPLTRKKLSTIQVIPNIALRGSIEQWKEQHLKKGESLIVYKTEIELAVKSKSEVEGESGSEWESYTDTSAESEPEVEVSKQPEPEVEGESGSEWESYTDTSAESEPEVEVSNKPEVEANGETGSEWESYTDTTSASEEEI